MKNTTCSLIAAFVSWILLSDLATASDGSRCFVKLNKDVTPAECRFIKKQRSEPWTCDVDEDPWRPVPDLGRDSRHCCRDAFTCDTSPAKGMIIVDSQFRSTNPYGLALNIEYRILRILGLELATSYDFQDTDGNAGSPRLQVGFGLNIHLNPSGRFDPKLGGFASYISSYTVDCNFGPIDPNDTIGPDGSINNSSCLPGTGQDKIELDDEIAGGVSFELDYWIKPRWGINLGVKHIWRPSDGKQDLADSEVDLQLTTYFAGVMWKF